jgi:arylsulfatase A-like enzyme
MEGFAALAHTRATWGNIAAGAVLKEVVRLYGTTVLAEGLTCGLMGIVLAVLLHLIHTRIAGPDRTRHGLTALVAGASTALFLSMYTRFSIHAILPLRRALETSVLETSLRVIFVCLLLGTAVGLLIHRFQGRRPAVLTGIGLLAVALSLAAAGPFLHFLGLKQVQRLMEDGRPEVLTGLTLALAATVALFLFWRLAASTGNSGRPGPLARWLDIGALACFALISLPGWMAGEPEWKSNQESTAGHWTMDRNVILISVDTLRGDRLEPGNPRRVPTPNIDRLAGGGVVFTNAQSPAPWTLPAVASMLTSLYPMAHGTSGQGSRLSPEMVTLAESISREGMTTKAVLANGWLNFPFNLHQGFDNYQFTYSNQARPMWWPGMIMLRVVHALGLGPSPYSPKPDMSVAESLVDKAITYLERNAEGNFFLWVHLVDPHDPYVARGSYRREAQKARGHGVFPRYDSGPTVDLRKGRMVGPGERRRLENLYDLEIRYTDDEVGRLLACLERLGLDGNTMVILTADHGEEFWEHGNVNHGHSLYEELLHIPLIIRPPTGYPVAQKHLSGVVRLIDVAPTVLDFLGIGRPSFWEGESLLPMMRGEETGQRPAFAGSLVYYQEQKSVRLGHYKYILTPLTGEEELYDLETDPRERVNLAPGEPDLAARMRVLLDKHLQDQEILAQRYPSLVSAEDEVDDRHIEELKALGYVQ